METAIVIVIGFIVPLVAAIVFFGDEDQKAKLEARLANASGMGGGMEAAPIMTVTDQELDRSFFDRVVKPFLDKLSKKEDNPKKKTSGQMAEIKKLLGQAGFYGAISADQFMTLWLISAAFMLIGGGAITFFVLKWRAQKLMFAVLVSGILGFLVPKVMLQRKAGARLASIQKGLPDVLDLLVVAVDAGLGFDQAISKVCEKMKGPITDEFKIVLKQTQMGFARKDAMREMSSRIDQPDLNSFIGAVIQAAELGVSLGQVLRVQSDQLKQKKKQRAEEAANKVPVLMMIPMVFFIFPTVFVVILAPAAFQIYVDLIAK